MRKRVMGSFVLLLAMAATTGCERAPTEAMTPEFKAAQGDMGEWALYRELGNQDGLYGEVPCLGDGPWFIEGTNYQWWGKEIITPSGNLTVTGYIVDANVGPDVATPTIMTNGVDTWTFADIHAPIVELYQDGKQRRTVNEVVLSTLVNDAGEIRRLAENIKVVWEPWSYDPWGGTPTVFRWTMKCKTVGGVPQR